MVNISKASKEVEVKETVKLTVTFEYELVNGDFQNTVDEAHYNKYIEYVATDVAEEE